MKKILLTFVISVAALFAVIIFAPSFIDWNQYRGELTTLAKSIVGRELTIKGDLNVAILPTPVFSVNNVQLANVEGATDANMISLESLEVHVALAPLLTRNIQVTSIKLVNPVINLEFLTEGRDNLSFNRKGEADQVKTNQEDVGASQGLGGGISPVNNKLVVAGFAVQIDNFLVENGKINYGKLSTKRHEKIENLNGRFRMASLNGPMDAEGEAVVKGIPISFSASVGQIVQGRTLPVNLATTIVPGEVKTSFNGTISNLKESPQVRGKLEMKGGRLDNLISAVAGSAELPGILARPFSAKANVAMDTKLLKLKDLEIQFVGTKGLGSAEVTLGGNIDAKVILSLNRFDLDELLVLPSKNELKSGEPSQDNKFKDAPGDRRPELAPAPSQVEKNTKTFGFHSLPATMSATVNLSVEALTYKNRAIRHAKLNASMTNKELTLSQVSGLLPGNSEFALFGFITQKKKIPTFDGTVEMGTNDFRGLLKWAGANVPGISRDRLNKFMFSGKLQASPKQIELLDLKMKIDGTNIRGDSKIVLLDQPFIDAGLKIDKINLDRYVAQGAVKNKSGAADKTKLPAKPALTGKSTPALQHMSGPVPLAGLNVLNGFNMNLKATINTLTFKGVRVSKIKINSSLQDGNLSLNNWTVQNLAGIRGTISGRLSGLKMSPGLPDPVLKDLDFDFRGKSFARFFRLLEIKSPIPPDKIGPFRLTAKLNGKPSSLKVIANLKALRGTFKLAGETKPFDTIPSITGRLKIVHPDYHALLRSFNVSYRPSTGKTGSVNLSARLSVSTGTVALNQFTGTLAGLKLRGKLKAKFDRPRPFISADIASSNINLNHFLPDKKVAYSFDGHNREPSHTLNSSNRFIHRASWSSLSKRSRNQNDVVYIAKNDNGRWSSSKIDLTFLNTFDADIALKTPMMILNGFKLENANLTANLQNGVFDIRPITGKLFGGVLKLNGTINASPGNDQYQTQFTLSRLDMPLAMRSFENNTLKTGNMDIFGNLRTNGQSVADLISHLNGSGSLSLTGVDISSDAGRGSAFSSVTTLLASINQFAGLLGGKTQSSKANLHAKFKVHKGIAKFDKMTLTSGIGSGVATGAVDLPNWQINTAGHLKLSENVVRGVFSRKKDPPTLPFQISGLLNQPNVRLDTSKFASSGISVPGGIGKRIDKILKKKGIGSILEKILPLGPSASPPQNSGPNAQPKQEPPQKQSVPSKPRPEDLIKNLLRGVLR